MKFSMAEAVEVPSWLKSLPLAPEFRPTEAEFADPVAYISKIEPEARSYGICKIVPPFPRVPKKTVMENLNRSLLLQQFAEGEVGNGPGGRSLLTPLGALQINSGSLSCRDMNISVSSPSSRKLPSPVFEGGELKAKFTTRRQLLGCTSVGRSKGSPQKLAQKRVWQSGESYTFEQFEAKAKQFSRTRLKTAKDLPALVIESLFWKAASEKSITVEYGNDIPASAFGEPSDSALEISPGSRKRKSTGMVSSIPSPTKEHKLETKEEERGYSPRTFARRKVQSSPEAPRRTTRSCKETLILPEETSLRKQTTSQDLNCSLGLKLDKSYWNMRVMARAPGSLLRYMPEDIPGITSPVVHIGMLFSWFAWHVEDHELQSVNYLHTGASKTWYAIPGDVAPAFEEVVCMYGYGNVHEHKAACALLGEKTTVLSPEVLVAAGVPCCRLVQNAGDFVVTFPRAYHLGFSHGFSCGEAANIATPGWLEVAQDAAIRRSALNCLPMLSHQQLLYLLALSFSPRSMRTVPSTPRNTRLKDRLRSLREETVKAVFVNDFAHLNRLLGLLLDAGASDCILLKGHAGIVSSQCSETKKSHYFSKENEETDVHNEISIAKSCPVAENEIDPSRARKLSGAENLSPHWGLLCFPCVVCGLICFPCMALVRPMRAFIKGTNSKEEKSDGMGLDSKNVSNQHELSSSQVCFNPHPHNSSCQSPIETSTYEETFDSDHGLDLVVHSKNDVFSPNSTSSYSDTCPKDTCPNFDTDPNVINLYQRKVVEIGNANSVYDNQSFAQDGNPPSPLCVPSVVVDKPARVEDMAEGQFDRVLTSNEKYTLASEVVEHGLEGVEVGKLSLCEEDSGKSHSLRPHFMCLEHALDAQQRLKGHGGSYSVIVCHSDISEIEEQAKCFAEELNISHRWRETTCRMANEEEKSLINYAFRSAENGENAVNDWVSQLGLKVSCRELHAKFEYSHQSCKDLTCGSPSKAESGCTETHNNPNNQYVNSCPSRNLSKQKKYSVAGRWCGKVWMNNEVHPALGGAKKLLKSHTKESSEMQSENAKYSEEASVEVHRVPVCQSKRVTDISVGDLEMLRDTKRTRELVIDKQGMNFDLKQNYVNHSLLGGWKGDSETDTMYPVAMPDHGPLERYSSDVDIWQDIDVGCCAPEVMSLDTIPEVSDGSLMVESCNGIHTESHDNMLLPGILRRRPCSVFDGDTEPRPLGQERDCTGSDFAECAFRSPLEPPIPEGLGYSMDLERKQEHVKVMTGNFVDVQIHPLGEHDYAPSSLDHSAFFEAGKYSVDFVGEDEFENGCLHSDSFGIGSKRISLHYQKLGHKTNYNLGSTNIDDSSELTRWRLSSNSYSSSSLLPCKNRTLAGKSRNKLKHQENFDGCVSDDEKSHKGTASVHVKKRRKKSMDEQIFDYAGFCSDGGISTRLRPRKATKVDEEVGINGENSGEIIMSSCKKSLKQPKPRVRKYSAKDTEDEFGAYSCDIDGCSMSFATKQELNVHKRNTCTFVGCGKRFGSHKYLLQHRRVHLDDRPLKCPWNGCGMTFKWKWACTEHYRVHTGERPYVCPVAECGRTFRFVSDFSRHKRKTGHGK